MMTETQIQRAASDDPGGWSKEVQFLAREVVRLRSELANTVKMDESPSKDQHIDKLNEDIKDLVSRCRRAENRAEYAEGRLRIAEADLKVLRSVFPSDHDMEREAWLNQQVTALTVRAENAEADVKQCQEVYAAARAFVRVCVCQGVGPERARLAKSVGL